MRVDVADRAGRNVSRFEDEPMSIVSIAYARCDRIQLASAGSPMRPAATASMVRMASTGSNVDYIPDGSMLDA